MKNTERPNRLNTHGEPNCLRALRYGSGSGSERLSPWHISDSADLLSIYRGCDILIVLVLACVVFGLRQCPRKPLKKMENVTPRCLAPIFALHFISMSIFHLIHIFCFACNMSMQHTPLSLFHNC
jgi:hypothetical protein